MKEADRTIFFHKGYVYIYTEIIKNFSVPCSDCELRREHVCHKVFCSHTHFWKKGNSILECMLRDCLDRKQLFWYALFLCRS
jgi:hypothetical protein